MHFYLEAAFSSKAHLFETNSPALKKTHMGQKQLMRLDQRSSVQWHTALDGLRHPRVLCLESNIVECVITLSDTRLQRISVSFLGLQ